MQDGLGEESEDSLIEDRQTYGKIQQNEKKLFKENVTPLNKLL